MQSFHNSLAGISRAPTRIELIVDWIGGVVGPVVCLVLDPVVLGGPNSHLRSYSIAAESGMVGFMFVIAVWLTCHPSPNVFAGLLYAGGFLAIAIGLAILPLSIDGLRYGIGALGLTPFLTALVFFRNARRAQALAGEQFRWQTAIVASLVCFLSLAIIQCTVWHQLPPAYWA